MSESPDKPVIPLGYSPPPALPAVPIYRRILAWVLGAAGVVLLVVGVFVPSESARVNILVVGGGLIVWGVVIRYQHVRLGP